MSDGRTHSLATVGAGFAFVGSAIGCLYLTPTQLAVAGLGCAFQMVYNGDCDVDNGFIGDAFVRQVIGTDIFYDFWLNPYRKAYKHRSFWTHAPLIGTLNRIGYLLCPAIIFLNKDQPTSYLHLLFMLPFAFLCSGVLWCLLILLHNLNIDLVYWTSGFIFGMAIADSIHWLFDWLGNST